MAMKLILKGRPRSKSRKIELVQKIGSHPKLLISWFVTVRDIFKELEQDVEIIEKSLLELQEDNDGRMNVEYDDGESFEEDMIDANQKQKNDHSSNPLAQKQDMKDGSPFKEMQNSVFRQLRIGDVLPIKTIGQGVQFVVLRPVSKKSNIRNIERVIHFSFCKLRICDCETVL